MMGAMGVAQTAIYRKATGYKCWAACQQGYACSEKTGTCERLPCGGGCPGSQVCEQRGAIEVCVEPTHQELEVVNEPEMCPVPDASPLLRVPCDAAPD
jgi:hypothetical protein